LIGTVEKLHNGRFTILFPAQIQQRKPAASSDFPR
jgi:hypothetical protein